MSNELSSQVGEFFVKYNHDKKVYECKVWRYSAPNQHMGPTGSSLIRSNFKSEDSAKKYMHGYHKKLEIEQQARNEESARQRQLDDEHEERMRNYVPGFSLGY